MDRKVIKQAKKMEKKIKSNPKKLEKAKEIIKKEYSKVNIRSMRPLELVAIIFGSLIGIGILNQTIILIWGGILWNYWYKYNLGEGIRSPDYENFNQFIYNHSRRILYSPPLFTNITESWVRPPRNFGTNKNKQKIIKQKIIKATNTVNKKLKKYEYTIGERIGIILTTLFSLPLLLSIIITIITLNFMTRDILRRIETMKEKEKFNILKEKLMKRFEELLKEHGYFSSIRNYPTYFNYSRRILNNDFPEETYCAIMQDRPVFPVYIEGASNNKSDGKKENQLYEMEAILKWLTDHPPPRNPIITSEAVRPADVKIDENIFLENLELTKKGYEEWKKKKFGKRRTKRRKTKRKLKPVKKKKVVKKIPVPIRKMCKKYKVRLTVKRGKKRVYKSIKILKKQCKNAMKRKK